MAINRRKPPIYNPQDIEPERLAKLFVIRTELREKLLASIRKYGTGKGRRHQLIVGARGLGKTTMLRSLYDITSGDTTLTAKLIPLRFREEQYNVDRPSEAVLNWIEALQSELEIHPEFSADADGLLDLAKQVRREVDEPRSLQAGVEGLRSWCQKRKRKLLLLLDNLDLILTRFGKSAELFGPVVCDEPWHMIVGGTAADTTFVTESTSPYCNQFEIHTLSNLSLAESRLLLDQLSKDREEEGDLLARLDSDRGRLETFHLLTGGNVRTTVLLHDVLASEKGGSLDAQLNALLDDHTNYFKSRFEAYSDQSQRVLDALMREWDPMTAAQLAEATRLEVQKVSAHLDRLVKQGIVQQVGYYNVDAKSPMGKHGYQIEERFFQIWFNMRMAPGVRAKNRMRWLAEFVHDLFGEDGIKESASRIITQLSASPLNTLDPLSHDYAKSLAEYLHDSDCAIALLSATSHGRSKSLSALIEKGQDLLKYSRIDDAIRVFSQIIDDADATPAQRANAFLARGCAHALERHLEDAIADFSRCAGVEQAPSEIIARALNSKGIANEEIGRVRDSIDDYTLCIELEGAPVDRYAWALVNRGFAYSVTGRDDLAIDDYIRCINILGAPAEPLARAWNNLAWTLYQQERDTRIRNDIFINGVRWDDIAAARQSLEVYPSSEPQYAKHTLACILALRGEWNELWGIVSELCPTDSELSDGVNIDDLIEIMQHAAQQGKAADAIDFLVRQGQQHRLRPLYEAMLVVRSGTIEYLKRVSPEVRSPAEEILYRMKFSSTASRLHHESGVVATLSNGTREVEMQHIHGRFVGVCKVGDVGIQCEFILDTGTSGVVIPEQVWTRIVSRSEFESLAYISLRGVGGESFEGRKAPMRISIIGVASGLADVAGEIELGVCDVVLLRDGHLGDKSLRRILLGLGGNLMTRNQLSVRIQRRVGTA